MQICSKISDKIKISDVTFFHEHKPKTKAFLMLPYANLSSGKCKESL